MFKKSMQFLFFVLLVVSFIVVGQVFIKKGLNEISFVKFDGSKSLFNIFIQFISNKFVIIGLLFAAIGTISWFFVLNQGDITFVFPLSTGFFYVLLFLISWLFLGETIIIGRIMGTLVILIGIIIVLLTK